MFPSKKKAIPIKHINISVINNGKEEEDDSNDDAFVSIGVVVGMVAYLVAGMVAVF